jgi:histidinol-phosphate aminotransferase
VPAWSQLTAGLAELGVESVPSKGNFLLAKVGDAARVNTELLKRGVIVRPVAAYGLPQFLRVSVGLAGQNARFLDALSVVLASEGGSPGAAALEPRPDPSGRDQDSPLSAPV